MASPSLQQPVDLVDVAGQPLRGRTSMAATRSVHAGADTLDPDLASWNPVLQSPDVELLPEWENLVARTRDITRNHGFASGAVQTHLDNIIGNGLRLVAKPDWRALGQSAEWAAEWSRIVESAWRQYADDIDCYCDAGQQQNFSGLLSLGYRSYMVSTELLAVLEWLPDRAPGKYATAVQMVLPDRLENPYGAADRYNLRGGVELGSYHVPLAYHFRQAHRSEAGWLGGPGAMSWVRVPRSTPHGRRRVIHIFDAESSDQTRGKPGFVSVLAQMRTLDRYQKSALQAAIVNAMYAAVIESSMPGEDVAAAMGGAITGNTENAFQAYMGLKKKFGEKNGHATYQGARVTHLLPGEQFKLLAAEHPTASYAEFESATLRHIAAGLNMSYEQLSRDYSKTNYSSARASMLEGWRFFAGRRDRVAGRFATLIYAAWLEEAMDRGDVPVPANAPSFSAAKTAWTRCNWIGAPRGHIDELKEREARQVAYDMHTTTLERECAEAGLDWEEVLEQRARESDRMRELNIDPSTLISKSRRNDLLAADSDQADARETEQASA